MDRIEAERDIALSALDRLDNLNLGLLSDQHRAYSIIRNALDEVAKIEAFGPEGRAPEAA